MFSVDFLPSICPYYNSSLLIKKKTTLSLVAIFFYIQNKNIFKFNRSILRLLKTTDEVKRGDLFLCVMLMGNIWSTGSDPGLSITRVTWKFCCRSRKEPQR